MGLIVNMLQFLWNLFIDLEIKFLVNYLISSWYWQFYFISNWPKLKIYNYPFSLPEIQSENSVCNQKIET